MTERAGDPTFGSLLTRHREQRGKSKADLARAAGLDPSSISRIESDERKPEPETIARVAEALALDARERRRLYHVAGLLAPDDLPFDADERAVRLARLLADPALPDDAKTRLRALLEISIAYAEAAGASSPPLPTAGEGVGG